MIQLRNQGFKQNIFDIKAPIKLKCVL